MQIKILFSNTLITKSVFYLKTRIIEIIKRVKIVVSFIFSLIVTAEGNINVYKNKNVIVNYKENINKNDLIKE